MSEFVDHPVEVKEIIRPFLQGNLLFWKGLPRITIDTLGAAIGAPIKEEEVNLGWYPARRYTYPLEHPTSTLAAYARSREVVLIEVLPPPPVDAMQALGEPSAILPHEILVEGTYVHEYLYSERGLVLSIAVPFQQDQDKRIVRCRGIRSLKNPNDFGPEFYQAFEDKTHW